MAKQPVNNLFLISLMVAFTFPAFGVGQLNDYKVNSPEISRPKRGTIQGEFSKYGEKSLQLVTGSFSTTLPLSFPYVRGVMQQHYMVAYSPSFGLSEYGIGWSNNIRITRSRSTGFINF